MIEKRLTIPKETFSFTVGDSPTVYTEADLPNHPSVQTYYDNWVIGRKEKEREWRNFELRNTDWMFVIDATFGGELLNGSTKLTEILTYRASLRTYNLTTDDRPTRPTWFQ